MASNSSKYPELHDRDWLERRYVTEGLSSTQIAQEIGCDYSSVTYHLQQFGIPVRGRHPGRFRPKACERCRKTFIPTSTATRYCPACVQSGRTWTCEHCQKSFTADVKRRFCSKKCRYQWRAAYTLANPISPRGERKGDPTYHARVNDDGYVEINVGRERSGRSDGRMLMHRYVMEEHLGRRLGKDELVHHKHGDRQDNRIEQLELCVKAQPPGQRVTDLLAWARAILARYGPEEALLGSDPAPDLPYADPEPRVATDEQHTLITTHPDGHRDVLIRPDTVVLR